MTDTTLREAPFNPASEAGNAEFVATEMVSLFIATVYGENIPIKFEMRVTYFENITMSELECCEVNVSTEFLVGGSLSQLRVYVPMTGTIAWGCENTPMSVLVTRNSSTSKYLLLSDAGMNDCYATIALDFHPEHRRCYIGDGFEEEVVCRLPVDEIPVRYLHHVIKLQSALDQQAVA